MSFEGYFQQLCKKGHYQIIDVDSDGHAYKCQYCNSPIIWENLVNETNGSFENNKRIDGFIELKIKKQVKCKHCNTVLETQYYIPKR